MKPAIDLNADVGEYADKGARDIEAELMTLVSSCSIACGGHAGDEKSMRETARLAHALGVSVGAHPSFPDLENFGRRALALPPAALSAAIEEQISALNFILEAEHIPLRHMKLHGALYNLAAKDAETAQIAAQIAAARRLVLFGPPGSALERTASVAGASFAAEGFIDRGYCADGSLIARDRPGAIIADIGARAAQAVAIARGEPVAAKGGTVRVTADTLCVHSDSPGAVETARTARAALEAAGVVIRPIGKA